MELSQSLEILRYVRFKRHRTCWNHIKMHLASSKSTLVCPRNQQCLPFICRYYGKHIAQSSLSVNKEQRRLKYISAAVLQGQCVDIFSRHYPPLAVGKSMKKMHLLIAASCRNHLVFTIINCKLQNTERGRRQEEKQLCIHEI